MKALSKYLVSSISDFENRDDKDNWQAIKAKLETGCDLESVLLSQPPTTNVEIAISQQTSSLILNDELQVIQNAVSTSSLLRLSNFLEKIHIPENGLPVITTNYDRLIEFAAESKGYGVDTMFAGQVVGRFDEALSKLSFLEKIQIIGRQARRKYRKRIRLFKPHGSVDWYSMNDRPVRIQNSLSQLRLMITPGRNKYLNGYEIPFDTHLARANEAIDKASRIIVIGYGFNDAHLETHLNAKICSGTPTLIITHTLSRNGEQLINGRENVVCLSAYNSDDGSGTKIILENQEEKVLGQSWWDLREFTEKVLV